jgi:putative transposase
MSAVPKREQQEVATELAGIWKQENPEQARLESGHEHSRNTRNALREQIRSLIEDEEHLLTLYAFPPALHRYIRSTNAHSELVEPRPPVHQSDRRVHAPRPVA